GSSIAEAALELVEQYAGSVLTHVTLVRVVDPEMPAGATDTARQYLDTARERLAAGLEHVNCQVDIQLLYGNAAEQILDCAEHGYDLVIMASHGRSLAIRWALGSVANRVVHHARIPLLLVPRRHEPAPGESAASEAAIGEEPGRLTVTELRAQ